VCWRGDEGVEVAVCELEGWTAWLEEVGNYEEVNLGWEVGEL
jgi:hypothetical protein